MKPNNFIYRTIAVAMLATVMSGCLPSLNSVNVKSSGESSVNDNRRAAYNGPKARVSVINFKDKTRNRIFTPSFGRGMADMLTTSLVNTDRYIVLERENINAIERERARYGRHKKKLEDSDLMITAAVTEWDPGTSGVKVGTGGLGGLFSSLGGSFKSAHVAIDLRLVDVDTGRILSATSVEGKASKFSGHVRSSSLGTGLSGFQKGPMESAIREVIEAATNYVVVKTPRTFYRY
jgi:curli biogenesis system outer membrane secretion channel CsgG